MCRVCDWELHVWVLYFLSPTPTKRGCLACQIQMLLWLLINKWEPHKKHASCKQVHVVWFVCFDLQVSWLRLDDTHLLTIGRLTYTSDLRFKAIHKMYSEDYLLQVSTFWNINKSNQINKLFWFSDQAHNPQRQWKVRVSNLDDAPEKPHRFAYHCRYIFIFKKRGSNIFG